MSWVQQPCVPAALKPKFLLFVTPVNAPDLPPDRRRFGFDNRNFYFFERGVRLDDACLAVAPLPDYPIRHLRVGQWSPGEPALWTADLPARPDRAVYRTAYRALTAQPPAYRALPGPRAGFNAYVTPARLTLAKAPCAVADTQARFVVHAEPVDPRVLAGRPFANLDFAFPAAGARVDTACLASVPLPAYPLRRLTVGQWQADADRMLWQTELRLSLTPAGEAAYRAHYRALAAATPALREPFRVYVTASAVTFAKEPCTESDTAPKFLLHILPAHRRGGFDNRDFHFAWQGAHFEGRCLARAPLPAYPIARLRVGQFRSDADPLWQAEIRGPRR